jgi:phosphatidylglycerol:prolipoprotein diacylglycerol transferase
MFPKILEIPLFGPGLQTSWPVFLGLVLALVALVTWGSKVAETSKLRGRLIMTLPLAAFLTAFLSFVETPFGKMPINSYGFCIMVGFLLASWIAVRRARPLEIKSDFILDVGIIGMIFGIVGAKINYLLQYHEDVVKSGRALWGDSGLNPLGALLLGPIPLAFWWWRTKQSGKPVKLYSWQNAVLLVLTLLFALVGTRALYLYQHRTEYSWELFRNWQSGFVLYGGLIAGVAASSLYIKMRGVSLGLMADLAAAPMMLGLAFGRLGCFFNGCCYGQKADGFLCMRFPPSSPAAQEQRKFGEWSDKVYPTQLFETAAAAAFFFFLSWLYRRKRKAQGEVFLIMVMLYGTWRFLIEFVRGDKRPTWVGDLSYSQVVSLVAFAVAGVWLFLLRTRAKPEPSGPTAVKSPPEAPADPSPKSAP